MAAKKLVSALKKRIDEAVAYQQKDLVTRPQWGSVTFESAQEDLDRIYGVLSHLKILPLEHLTDQAVKSITGEVGNVIDVLTKVDGFNIEQGNPPQVRDGLVNEVHQRADQLYTVATPWIPYLAYVRGDVEANINALTQSVEAAASLIDEAKEDVEQKKEELDSIITTAREASAAAGAAVFTKDFDGEAATLKGQSKSWLIATVLLGGMTTALAVAAFFVVESGLDAGEIIQKSAARLAVLAIFFTATLWCGRIYKALLHQATINRHRALSLQTFQAFSQASPDPITKDAVLLESTRAIFGNVPTGFVDGGDRESAKAVQLVGVNRQIPDE